MGDDTWLASSSTSRHFFKIVLPGTLRDRKIRVPKKFVRKYGESLLSPVILEFPSGLGWKVELTLCDGEVWLRKGWPELADHLSIESGYLLVFRYEGNSHFHVIIFDTSAVEIDYPTNATHFDKSYIDEYHQLQEPKREEFEDDDSVEILGDHPSLSLPKAREKLHLRGSRPQKRKRSSVTMRTPSSCGLTAVFASGEASALERVSGFKSENPFFKIVINRTHAHRRGCLLIPTKFVESYISKKVSDLTLRVSDGRSWSGRYRSKSYVNGLKGTRSAHEISYHGWKAFVQENSLEVGDVCIFELISGGNDIPLFQVSIDRHSDHLSLDGESAIIPFSSTRNMRVKTGCVHTGYDETCTVSEVDQMAHKESQSPHREQNGVEVPSGSKLRSSIFGKKANGGRKIDTQSQRPLSSGAFEGCSKNPSFQVLMGSSYVNNSSLRIPATFGKSYLQKMRKRIVTLRVGKKCWVMKLSTNPTNKAYFLSRGWCTFARDNSLCVGDICRFEMIESNNFLELQVFVTRVK